LAFSVQAAQSVGPRLFHVRLNPTILAIANSNVATISAAAKSPSRQPTAISPYAAASGPTDGRGDGDRRLPDRVRRGAT
jgi:hypothetical protein